MLLGILKATARPVAGGITRILSVECPHTLARRTAVYERKAKRIVNENELFGVEFQEEKKLPRQKKEKKKSVDPQTEGKTKGEKKVKSTKEVEGTIKKQIPEKYKNLPMFTKLHENESMLSTIMLTLTSKKKRKKEEKVVLEGSRLIKQALEAGLQLEDLIFSQVDDIKDLPIRAKSSKAKLYKVPYRSIQLWSTLTTSPGIMAIFKKPDFKIKPSTSSLPLTIICDNVRDPGNLGSILRAAAGAGCEQVILTKGCTSVWENKVIRASTGAHFCIPIEDGKTWEEIEQYIGDDSNIYVADNNTNRYLEEEIDPLAMNDIYDGEKLGKILKADLPKYSEREEEEKKLPTLVDMKNLPCVPYYGVDFAKSHVVLIVGGETEGLSHNCFNLVSERKGVRVNVPLDNNIDSLNTGVAIGVIAFEVKRQFLLLNNQIAEKKREEQRLKNQ